MALLFPGSDLNATFRKMECRATRNWSMPDKVYLNPETKVEITNISKEKEALAS